ncbi:hypothetical protein [Kitasatospora sp. NPDC096204]|uniref:RapZ C-terminal domain-containing protein n=1 Tax=Kitasatospora sp. NPDC096204 TaxID=3364094 RepID=UPI00380F8594
MVSCLPAPVSRGRPRPAPGPGRSPRHSRPRRPRPRVQQIVLNNPGARELIDNLAAYASLPAGPRRIAIGCAGGRHRASGLTEILANELRQRGHQVEVEHLHVHLPRVLKTPQ